MSRADRLRAFVDALGPVVWGESDCCAAWARWIAAERNMPVTLPRYSSREEAHALIESAGGLLPLVEHVLAPLKLPETSTPVLGDVGVIRFAARDVGVIFAEAGIVLWRRDDGDVVFLNPKTVLAAWTV